VKALVWEGVSELAVTSVPDPRIRIRQDAILKVNIAIDRYGYRLEMTEREVGCEVLDYERTDVDAELRERTGGRGSLFVLGVFSALVDKFPPGGGDEQGLDPARRPAARRALHPDAARPDGQGRAQDGHLATRCPWTRARSATTCSRTRRTAASARSSNRQPDTSACGAARELSTRAVADAMVPASVLERARSRGTQEEPNP
jgi:Alcohol dehydrogenase GroES-associated